MSAQRTSCSFCSPSHVCREDDTNWPKKNIVGKQELEIRVGNDHIAFEVRYQFPVCRLTALITRKDRQNWLSGRYSR